MDRLFALDQQTLVQIGIQLLNACVLAAVLTLVLYKPVRKFLHKRAEGIRAQIDRAEDQMAIAEKTNSLYEAKLGEIEQERAAILEEARRLAADQKNRTLEDTKQEVSAMRARAKAAIETERERAGEEIRLHIIEVAAAMAEKFVADAFDQNAHDRLFAETLAELEGAQ